MLFPAFGIPHLRDEVRPIALNAIPPPVGERDPNHRKSRYICGRPFKRKYKIGFGA
jgi:hypothetical protein